MDTVSAIFERCGGPAAVGRAISKTTEHATLMRRRQSIPVGYWPALIVFAEANNIAGITYHALVEAHSMAPAAPAPERKGAAA